MGSLRVGRRRGIPVRWTTFIPRPALRLLSSQLCPLAACATVSSATEEPLGACVQAAGPAVRTAVQIQLTAVVQISIADVTQQ
jgi:hypothetical protein